ncbi:MAG: hypothetical protein QME58_11780, partial [Bacteroidota bacterium]|nr:hypothetical protein [Bacteroidota bacterium]
SGNKYSVPYHFACKEVWIQVSRGYILKIYSQKNIQIAQHHIYLGKGKVILNKEHYKNHRIEKGNFERLRVMFLEMFPGAEWFIDKIKVQKKINHNYHLTQILDIAKLYPSEDVLKSLQTALQYNTFSYPFIKGYLENHSMFFDKPNLINSADDGKKHFGQDIKRPLNYYKLKETIYEN